MAEVAAGAALVGIAGQVMAGTKSADQNAAALEQQAKQTELNAAYDEQQQRRVNKLAAGEAQATMAATGFVTDSGSPMLMALDRAKQQEMQALNIRRGGQAQAQSLRYGAGIAKASKWGTIVGGAAQGGSILAQYVGRGNGQAFSAKGFGAANSTNSPSAPLKNWYGGGGFGAAK